MRMPSRHLRRFVDGVYLAAGAGAALCLVAMFLLILAQIVARQLGAYIPSSGELIGFLVVWSAFLGLAYTMHQRAHIRVELFLSTLLPGQRRLLNIASGALALAVAMVFIFYAFALVRESFLFSDVSDGEIPLPLYLVQLPMLVGFVLFTFSLVDYTLSQLFASRRRTGSSDGAGS